MTSAICNEKPIHLGAFRGQFSTLEELSIVAYLFGWDMEAFKEACTQIENQADYYSAKKIAIDYKKLYDWKFTDETGNLVEWFFDGVDKLFEPKMISNGEHL